jgi:ATP-dependent Clp protease ATP-binding subunit ClpA
MIHPNKDLEHIFDAAIALAVNHSHEYITLEHFLYSMVADENFSKLLVDYGANVSELVLDLEKYIDEVLQKVSKLTKSIEGNFELDQNEDGLNYKVLTEEKLKKIKMMKRYF